MIVPGFSVSFCLRPTLAALIESHPNGTSARKIGGRRTSHRGKLGSAELPFFCLPIPACQPMKIGNAWPEPPLNYVTKSSRKAQRHACYSFCNDGAHPSPVIGSPPMEPQKPRPVPPRLAGLLLKAGSYRHSSAIELPQIGSWPHASTLNEREAPVNVHATGDSSNENQ